MALSTVFTRHPLGVGIVVAAAFVGSSSALAQNAFTYQGQLKSAGAPYNGTADLRFTLYDAAAGGNVIGAPETAINVTVVDGLVTTDLDFGALAFDGTPRWLLIEVKTPSTGGAGPYSPLTPRQPVTPSPYAMHAAVAGSVPDAALIGSYTNALSMTNSGNIFAGDGSGLVALDAASISAGTLGDGRLGGSYSNALSLTNAGNSFAGNGSGLTNLDWSNLVSVPAGFADGIDDVGVGTSQWSGAAGGNIHYTVAGANVGIGRSSPLYKLDVSAGTGQGIRLGLDGNGGGNLLLLNNTGDNRIYVEGYNSTNSGSATEMLFTGFAGGLIPRLTMRASIATAEGQLGVSPTAGFVPHPDYRMHVRATSLNGLFAESTGATFALVGINTGPGGNGVYGSASGANSRGGQFWTNTGFCAASGDHTGGGTYGLLGTANEGIYGNGGPSGKTGIVGVAGGSTSSGVVGAQVGTSTSASGVFGYSTASAGNGVIGEANTGTSAYGVWGRAAQGIGGYFSGGQYAVYAAGKARCTTIEIAGGSDLAEPFDVAHVDEQGSQQDIEPGMVVVIDPANPGALKVSIQANDRKVAGIISGANDLAPGMIMKSEGQQHADGDHPVALTGRVWCWCDASTGAIEPGDMLTTSDTAGHAMRAVDLDAAQGAIIGKAMTPLASGERGLVLVLVNLQ